MPNPTEIAEVTINGEIFRDWKSLVFERTYHVYASTCILTCVEVGDINQGWSNLKIKPGDSATVTLAGQLAVDGRVAVRRVRYAAEQHELEIHIVSFLQVAVKSSVKVKPGEYKNYKFADIANDLLGKFGLTFRWDSQEPPGAGKTYPRVNLGIGEPVMALLERIARIRNIYFHDDEQGNLVGFRGDGSEGNVATLREGVNIKAADGILRDDYVLGTYQTFAQKPGNDNEFADPARNPSATGQMSGSDEESYGAQVAPHQGDPDDARMANDRTMGENLSSTTQVTIVVYSWLLDDGSLWCSQLGKQVTVYSPMLFPTDSMTLYIRGAKHMQDDRGGTETHLDLCLLAGLGDFSGQPQDVGQSAFPPSPTPSQPDGSD